MSDSVDNVLAHYGVKGMRWGVRKGITTEKGRARSAAKAEAKAVKKGNKSAAKAEKKAVKEDLKWAKKSATLRAQVKVYNEMAKHMNEKGLGEVNSNPKFAGKKPLLSNDIKLRQDYLDTVSYTANRAAQSAHKKLHGDSPNGKLDVQYTYDSSSGVKAYIGTPEELGHADSKPTGLKIKVEDGYIVHIGDAELRHGDVVGVLIDRDGTIEELLAEVIDSPHSTLTTKMQ